MPKREPEPKTILNLEEVLQEERQALGASPDEKLSALCLSGGGIRSATFGLGVLQGLAKFGLLPQFHYVSTVSGGGYIGGWLSAWISRDPEGAAGVSSKLSAPSTSGVDPECAQLQWLRNFSNYLNPKLGLLSADTWALVATVLRNMLLNWLVLLPLLTAVLVIPRFCYDVARWTGMPGWLAETTLVLGFACAVASLSYVRADLPSSGGPGSDQRRFLVRCLAPLYASTVLLSLYWISPVEAPGPGWFVFFGALLCLAGSAIGAIRAQGRATKGEFLGVLGVGALGGIALWATGKWVFSSLISHTDLYVCFAAPWLLGLFLLAAILFVGILSNTSSEEDREWFARASAWVLIAAVAWLGFSAIALLAPKVFAWLGPKIKAAIASLGGISGIVSVLTGHSPKTSAKTQAEKERSRADSAIDLATKLAAPTFVVLLLAAISLVTADLVERWVPLAGPLRAHFLGLGAVFFGALVIGGVSSLFVNINRFSLHAMYRNRLIRAYLGASRPKLRQPHPFTGFDPKDNLPMHELASSKPLHIVNIALNLVKGSRLAWQQRKAESFTVSRLHAGSFRLAYRRSLDYGDGISLGTAVTISGAAASPNMGYHSSPVVTFLMTLFNARLGWWLGNPGTPGGRVWKLPGPYFAIHPLVEEALGLTTDTSKYVYLSDGGHFENLGLYEMVLRRCHFIVVADASCDPQYHFEDLANAIRKIRIDLGIPIEFAEILIDPKLKSKGAHFAIGRICYPKVDPGVLLYIKPVVTGDEPADVIEYASSNEPFPHQSTLDQWFDESQFESYRALGRHSIEQICGTGWQGGTIQDLGTRLGNRGSTALAHGATIG